MHKVTMSAISAVLAGFFLFPSSLGSPAVRPGSHWNQVEDPAPRFCVFPVHLGSGVFTTLVVLFVLFILFSKLSVGPLYSYWLARSSYQAFSPQLGTHKNRNRNKTHLFCPWRLTQGHPVRQSPGNSCLGDGSRGGVSESRRSSDSFTPCQCRAVHSGPEPRE